MSWSGLGLKVSSIPYKLLIALKIWNIMLERVNSVFFILAGYIKYYNVIQYSSKYILN